MGIVESSGIGCFRAFLVLAMTSLSVAHGATLAISSGQAHNLAIHADGTLKAWGNDLSGELGDARVLAEQAPTIVPGLANARAVSAGFEHSVALMRDGTVWAWGNNDFGQLGDGTGVSRTTPMPVPGLANIVAVSAGWFHTLALGNDGRVWAWGSNYFGQLGDGTNTNRSTPIIVPAAPRAVAIAAGIGHSVIADTGGIAWAWGDNSYGQIGDGTRIARLVPVRIAGVSGVTMVSARNHTLALATGGSVWSWGGGYLGLLGDGSTTDRAVPSQIPGLLQIVAIAAGVDRDLVVTNAGSVLSWGQTFPGGVNLAPAPVSGMPAIASQVTDGFQSFIATSSGSVEAWNGFSPPQAVSGISNVVSISASAQHVVAVDRSGAVFAWGSNVAGQLGLGSPPGRLTPVSLRLPSPAVSVAAGSYYSAAATADGTVWTWGANYAGMLGDGSYTDRPAPVQASVPSPGALAVAAGDHHTVALLRNGTVFTWGGNEHGQLGRVTEGSSTALPAQVPDLVNIKAIAAGGAFSLALTQDGRVLAWGDNARGQLGDGTTFPHGPAIVLSGVVEIAAGRDHALAVKADGSVWAWGANDQGQLGDNTTVDRGRPVQVAGLPPATQVAASLFHHSLALAADGTVWGWGRNGEGELGDGTLLERHSPVRSAGLTGVTAIAAGWTHSTAIKSDGTAWAWGYNASGQVGDGSLATRAIPTVVVREGGGGNIATNDWFLDLDPSNPSKTIPPSAVPAFLALSFGDVLDSVVTVGATLKFRTQDVGQPFYIFAYAPSAIVKNARGKDASNCQLAQLLPSGGLGQATASSLQAAVGNVVSSNAQAVSVLNNVSSSQVAGATLCVGTGATSAAAVTNSACVATVPPSSDGGAVCLSQGSAGTSANSPGALSGLWWNPAESGWGIDFTQRGSNVFAAWYTYDAAGNPKWYVASNCTMPAAGLTSGACSGALYEVNGPTFFGTAFNPLAAHVTTAGSLQVTFADSSNASMSYTVAGQSRTVSIIRELLAAGTTPPPVDYTDLWWNPAESGWGLTIAQQYDVIFVAWYVYDSGGKPVWLVVPNCPVNGNGCTGALYRTTGPPFGPTFDTTRVHASVAGSATLTFTDPNNGRLEYTVDGVAGSKEITRELF